MSEKKLILPGNTAAPPPGGVQFAVDQNGMVCDIAAREAITGLRKEFEAFQTIVLEQLGGLRLQLARAGTGEEGQE